MAAAVGVAAFLYFLLQLARSGQREAKQEARTERERADTSEALRNLERDVQAARGVAQEKARETKQDQHDRQAADDRPHVFGDQRLHARTKDRL